jgi:hypothetical protein
MGKPEALMQAEVEVEQVLLVEIQLQVLVDLVVREAYHLSLDHQ